MRHRDQTPAAEPVIGPGDAVGGFRVEQIVRASDGRWLVAAAVAPDGRRAVLRVSTLAAAANPRQQERVARLERLRRVEEVPLVPVLAAGEDAGRLYVAWPCLDGRTLAERLREGRLEPDEAVRLLSQVAGGLETLRAFGLPHAVPTPDRILLTARRPTQALFADYGFGPPPAPAGATAALADTVDYLAPEAAQGHPEEPASTVYALACVLVECLTGAPPYPYDRPLLVLQAHLTADPPRVSERADLPRPLDRVIAAALSAQPEQRQRSTAALMRATQRAVGKARPPILIVEPSPEQAPAPPDVAAAAARRPARTGPAAPAPRRAARKGQPETPGPRRAARRGTPAVAATTPSARRAVPEAAAARPLAAAARRAEARKRARRRPSLPTRRLRWPLPAGVGIGAILVLASSAGFATASLRTTPERSPAPAPAPRAAAPSPRAAERMAYARAVDQAVNRLSTQRANTRRRLRHARHSRAQATAAAALAAVYRDARRALPPAPAGVAGADGLPRRLAAAQKAYMSLAAAARAQDSAAFGTAARDVVAREAAVTTALDTLARQLRARPA
jgi:hypothetical protein